ncbi:MAG: BrnT family toxin [Chloroflexota bacterium]
MFIEEFIWLPDVIDKLISKHQVTPEEVEDIFFNRPRFRFHEKGRVQGENMYTAIGQTDGGRYLVVFFIFKSSHRALIISARDMNHFERKYYGRKK